MTLATWALLNGETMLNHPYENGTGTCDCCDETQVPTDEYGGVFYDFKVGDCTGWRCEYCEDVIYGGDGSDWSSDDHVNAERMWQSLGKSTEFVDGPEWTQRWSWEFYR